MSHSCIRALAFLLFAMTTDPTHADDTIWRLTFAEEGVGPAGTPPDPTMWTHDVGGHGWGNAEPQTYTSPEHPAPGGLNAFHDGEGHLVIEARREDHTGPDGKAAEFTSARLLTQGLFSQAYGRFEARIRLPQGQGIWPAFWMLGDSFAEVSWPRCGEIDIMEFIGHELNRIHGTVHGPGYSGVDGIGQSTALPEGESYADGFQVFAVEWRPNEIQWFVNGEHYHTVTPDSLTNEDGTRDEWVFNAPHFLILNIATGGHWPQYPDETTEFPQRMLVDYVRVYEQVDPPTEP
ncbi:MAG: glycoside hydrolase family 16 protein [Planctomycetota bacterium]